MPNTQARVPKRPPEKNPGGRPKRRNRETTVSAMQTFLVRYRRYSRRGLSQFALALAVWCEFTDAGVRPLLLAKLTAYERATLKQQFDDAGAELADELPVPPTLDQLAHRVATMYRPEDPLAERATRQVRELAKVAKTDEYVHLGASRLIPFVGLVPHKSQVEAFNAWRVLL
jgi:hypothetical protein